MTKFHKRYIYYILVRNLFIMAFVSFLAFVEMIPDGDEPIEPIFILISIGIGAAYYIIAAIYAFLYRYTSGYQFKEKEIQCNRGVLYQRKSLVEYQKMHAINKKQNILQKIFKISTLMVDSGSTNTAHQAEIMIIEDDKVVDTLLNKLRNKQNHLDMDMCQEEKEKSLDIVKEENLYTFTNKRKILYSGIQVFTGLFGVGALVILLGIFVNMVFYMAKEFNTNFLITSLLVAVVSYFVMLFFIFLGGILHSFVDYYDFKIVQKEGNLEISYGLLVKVHNTLHLKRVKAIEVKQPFFKRILGFASLNLEMIGYGEIDNNSAKNVGVLIPLCKINEVTSYLENILPEYQILPPSKTSHSYASLICMDILFISLFFLYMGALMLTILVKVNMESSIVYASIGGLIGIYILVIAFICINAFMEYKTNSISMDENKITIYHEGFAKEIVVILKENLIGIESVTTPLRCKKNVFTYKIHYRTNSMSNVVKVRCLHKDLQTKLLNMLTY